MPTPQETIDQFSALQGSGSQIPGIVREGNSFSAAPGSQLAGDLSAIDARRPAPMRESADPYRSYDAAALGQLPPDPNQGASWQGLRVDRIAEAQKQQAVGDSGPILRDGNAFRQALAGPEMSYPARGVDVQSPAANTGVTDKPPRQTSFSETGSAAAAPGMLLRDGFGNDTGPVRAMQAQLDRLRAENAATAQAQQPAERAPGSSYAEQRQAEADRFTRFVNESSTAALAHDLGTGGGTLRTNAGKIAALQNMQLRDAAAQQGELTRAANIIGANTARGAQNVQTKGQQLQHDTALAQILGSPAQQQGQLLDAAIKSGQLNAAQVLQSFQQKLIEAGKNNDADGQARYALLIQQLQGKSPESKLISFGGGQVVGPDGQLITQPSRIAYTGQAPTVIDEKPQAPRPKIGDTIAGAKDGEGTYGDYKVRIKDGKIVSLGEATK